MCSAGNTLIFKAREKVKLSSQGDLLFWYCRQVPCCAGVIVSSKAARCKILDLVERFKKVVFQPV